ncbi:mediator of RNA polymerase II transcription subunit 7-like [Actinia tenebrosa]|uniref:Mediator of RNA polymerase II transcription subunit 7 n=1 Tax=Actinia tenebrosa TaxID=6105 RepID=A0A6P8HN84_ACTTE|nr:mediator of RNA polymerase II transcription subunit 7-like [Actinia tenebrosa]
MAAEGVSPFPLPPTQYYTLYTDSNVEQDRAPKPPPPIEGTYAMFGASFESDDTIIRPLESQGIARLYPQHRRLDRITELKKLNHSIVINFLELLDILIKTPSSAKRDAKLEDMRLLFINMHHLINELRPHQARETLRVMMERQKRQRLETADKLQKHINRVVTLLQNSSSHLNLIIAQDSMATQQTMMDIDEASNTQKSEKAITKRKEDLVGDMLEKIT